MMDVMELPPSGAAKVAFCERLLDEWRPLADYLEIPPADTRRFARGDEPRGVWEWLERRGQLDRLRAAVEAIGRDDLIGVLRPPRAEADLAHWHRVLGSDKVLVGRERTVEHISRWLGDPTAAPVCIVTGDPGSGKSAVLAHFALRQCPGVDSRERTVEEVVRLLAAQVGSAACTFRRLWDDLAESDTPVCLLIDSIDESVEPAALMRQAQAGFRRNRPASVKLLLGTRRRLVPDRHPLVSLVDLDSDFADRRAIKEYVLRILRGRAAFRNSRVRAMRVAAAVAKDAGDSFLVARLNAEAMVARGVLPDPGTSYPSSVGDAMRDYLDALDVNRLRAEDLLRPLAYARGPGLPRDLWVVLAGELAGVAGKYRIEDTRDLLDGPLADFVVATRVDRRGERRSRVTYRLFHEALDEHLTGADPAYPDAPRAGLEARDAIAEALLATAPANWAEADQYLLDHLIEHAAGTPTLSRLVRSPLFLASAERNAVLRTLPHVDGADLSAAQAYESVVHRLDSPDRHAYLVLAAHRVGDPTLIAAWDQGARPNAWWPVAALWRRMTSSRVLYEHQDAVEQVVVAHSFGEDLVISSDGSGESAVTGVVGTASDAVTIKTEASLHAAVVAVVDGLPLVVAGDDAGGLHRIDLPAGEVEPGPAADRPGVSAVAWHSSADHVAVGRRDGSLELSSIFPLAVLPFSAALDGTEVAGLVAAGEGTFVAATGGGRLLRWNPRGEVAAVDDSLPRVTAIGSGADGAILTGHDDGTLRYWLGGLQDPVVISSIGVLPVTVAVAEMAERTMLLAAGDDENDEVAVVDLPAGRRIAGLTGHDGPIWSLAVLEVGSRTMVVGGGEDGKVRLWRLDDLLVPPGSRPMLPEPWQPLRLAEHHGKLCCLALSGTAEFAILDGLTGDLVDGPWQTPEGQELSALSVTVYDGQLRWAAATALGRVGAAVVGSSPQWTALPDEDWVAGLAFGDGHLFAVAAGGQVRALDLGLRRRPGRDFRVTGHQTVIEGAWPAGDGRLMIRDRAGDHSWWKLADGAGAVGEQPEISGDATGWVTAGEVRVDVGASIRDVLRRDDGTIAIATGYGIVLLTVSRQGDGRWTTSTA